MSRDLSNENIVHIQGKEIEYLQFRRLLKYKIPHAYAVGIDKNFRTSRGDGKSISIEEYEQAIKSYKDLCKELNLEYKNLIKTNQTHTKNVMGVYENANGPDFSKYKNTDGLITNKSEIILATTNADCILMLFYDPQKNVIANIHSGWRGTLQRISVETITQMEQKYECNAKDIICCICPSIRKCHFEVDKDVYDKFRNEFKELKNMKKIVEKKGDKWFIDTVLINKEILKEKGIKEENIIDSGICSVCNKELIHSYRAEGVNYGLSTAIISLNKNYKYKNSIEKN